MPRPEARIFSRVLIGKRACQNWWHHYAFLGFGLRGLASETVLTGIAASGTIWMVHILHEHSRDGEMAEKFV